MNHNAKLVAALLLLSLALVLAGPASVLPAQGWRTDSARRDGRLPDRPERKSSRDLQRRVLDVCRRLAAAEGLSGRSFSIGSVRHLDVRPVRGPRSRESVFRHRGRPGLVAGHAVRHRNAEVHHGRSGAEFRRMGQRSRRGQRKRLAKTRRQVRRGTTQSLAAVAARRPEPETRHVRRTVRLRLSAAAAHSGQSHHRREETSRPGTTAGRCS